MSPVQRQDFQAVDPALKYIAGLSKDMPDVRKFWRQRSRGYSKSTDIGSDLIWLLCFTVKRIKGFVAAADRDQAKFIHEQIERLVFDNPWLNSYITIHRNEIISKNTGSTIKFITSDGNSSFGDTPDIVVMDEFTHWPDNEKGKLFYTSCFSSYGKREDQGAVMLVGCNAGFGRSYHWDLKQTAIQDDLWYHSSPEGASPWYSETMLRGQRSGISEGDYKRLWENEWQDSGGAYVTLSEAKKCVDPNRTQRAEADPGCWAYIAAIDYAEKIDRTVGVVAHREYGKIVIDRMDVVTPEMFPEGITPVSWCEDWLVGVNDRFGTGHDRYGNDRTLHVIVDDNQLKWLIQKYTFAESGPRLNIFPFKFGSGKGNHELAHYLRSTILNGDISWYPGCGEITDSTGTVFTKSGAKDDLCTELAALYVKERNTGRWRFDHVPGQHDDRAFAVGAIVHYIRTNDASDIT